MSTVAVPLNLEGESIYAASKSAVESLTKIVAKEFGYFGITCNAIGPSPIDTSLIRGVPKEKIAELVKQQAVGAAFASVMLDQRLTPIQWVGVAIVVGSVASVQRWGLQDATAPVPIVS
jgi:NAD(P)-dependent dehydrogenase (short-subunit alcohol dehydrogenase family)